MHCNSHARKTSSSSSRTNKQGQTRAPILQRSRILFTRSCPHSIFKRWDTPGFTRDYQVDGYCDGWMDDELLLPFLYLSPHFSPSIYQSLSHHHRHHRGPWNRVDASSFPGVDLWRDIKISTADHRARISQGTDIRVCPKSWIIQRLSHL